MHRLENAGSNVCAALIVLTRSAHGAALLNVIFKGDLKPPFNIAARNAAHFSAAFYGPLAARDDLVASPEKRPDA